MPDEEKFYDLICKERFDNIDKKQQEILDVLKGKNNDPGLCERIRDIEKVHKRIFAAIIGLIVIITTQVVDWIYKKFTGI